MSELPVEGLIHVTSLADDYYYLESGTHTLVGRRSGRRHRLGDRAIVRIAHVDVDRRELDLVLADSPVCAGTPGEGRPGRPPHPPAVAIDRHDRRRPRPFGRQRARRVDARLQSGGQGPSKKKATAKVKKSARRKRTLSEREVVEQGRMGTADQGSLNRRSCDSTKARRPPQPRYGASVRGSLRAGQLKQQRPLPVQLTLHQEKPPRTAVACAQ